jgi:hypothetical protein
MIQCNKPEISLYDIKATCLLCDISVATDVNVMKKKAE